MLTASAKAKANTVSSRRRQVYSWELRSEAPSLPQRQKMGTRDSSFPNHGSRGLKETALGYTVGRGLLKDVYLKGAVIITSFLK